RPSLRRRDLSQPVERFALREGAAERLGVRKRPLELGPSFGDPPGAIEHAARELESRRYGVGRFGVGQREEGAVHSLGLLEGVTLRGYAGSGQIARLRLLALTCTFTMQCERVEHVVAARTRVRLDGVGGRAV